MGCDNLTNGTSPRTLPYTFQTSAPLTILVGILILLTVFGNVLVVIAVFTSRSLKAPQNLFLVSLASADILVATLVIPFSLANELMGFWYFGKVWCEIYQALDVLFCTSSIVHLCAISLDRYWSVTQAVEYNLKRTPKRIKCIIFVVWVIAAVISFPPLIPMEGTKDEDLTCEMNEEKWYIISSCIGSFFAPCIIMILVYVRIYQIAKGRARAPPGKKTNGEAVDKRNSLGPPRKGHGEKLERDRGAGAGEVNGMDMEDSSSSDQNVRNPCSPKLKKGKRKGKPGPSKPEDDAPRCGTSMWKGRQNREKRFTFVLAVVIGVFVVCWFPFFFTYTLTAVCDSCCVPKTVFKFFFWFGYCNSCLNPVIYTIFNNDFRRAFKKILCKGERKEII